MMKKLYKALCSTTVVLGLGLFTSCISLVNYTPNTDAMKETLPADVTNYCDYKVEKCKFPDGKIATAYVFNNVDDAVLWQNCQALKYQNEYQERAKSEIRNLKAQGYSDYDYSVRWWKWAPTGPLSPYAEAEGKLRYEYGNEKARELIYGISIHSFYKTEDLGQLATYLTTPKSVASACYQDFKGVYLLSICPAKYLTQFFNNKEFQKQHEGEFAYEIIFVPKHMYANIELPKLKPAKVTPFNPNNVPDSDRNFAPVAPSGNGAYYYDSNLAYQLQWLAVETACKGVYDMAYTGDFRAKNPTDYYKTSFIKKYLATNDGRASKGTTLFEGICFDYADFAYQELTNNRNAYPNVARFWMVGTFNDPNDIISYRIARDGESSNMTINRTPVVLNAHSHIYAHDGATGHAWFWVQSTDGTIYWIDPTWTDNTGRPVYGIVRGGREIALEPDPNLSVR